MNRKPETKTAAQLITAAFGAQGVRFGHQAALNLLATLEGYESFAQMKVAQSGAPQAVPAQQADEVSPESFTAHLLFSEDDCSVFREVEGAEHLTQALGPVKSFTYPTPELLGAFLDGVEEACGWLEYKDVTSVVVCLDAVSKEGLSPSEQEARLADLRRSLAVHDLRSDDILQELTSQ